MVGFKIGMLASYSESYLVSDFHSKLALPESMPDLELGQVHVIPVMITWCHRISGMRLQTHVIGAWGHGL